MKLLAIMLVFLLAVPLPRVLTGCEVQTASGTTTATAGEEPVHGGHDCCSDEEMVPPGDDACDEFSHCSACFAGNGALPAGFRQAPFLAGHTTFSPKCMPPAPSHDRPPYRPPIT